MKERLKKFDFLGHRKIYYIFCIVLIIALRRQIRLPEMVQ